jgi:aminopeptidase YwaD
MVENKLSRPRFHYYNKAGKRLRNVLADLPGKNTTTILLSAHYDSRMERLGDAQAPAPGANDNATGVAVLLEVARLLQNYALTDNLHFVLFSGEEQGLWGSQAYAKELKAKKTELKFVFNLDQIGYPPPDRAIYVDRDEGGRPENNASSAALVERIQKIARTLKIPTRVDPAYGSDYIPFEQQGYTIVGLYEAGKDYPQYHSTKDTVDRVDFPYVFDMARLATATILHEGGLFTR